MSFQFPLIGVADVIWMHLRDCPGRIVGFLFQLYSNVHNLTFAISLYGILSFVVCKNHFYDRIEGALHEWRRAIAALA